MRKTCAQAVQEQRKSLGIVFETFTHLFDHTFWVVQKPSLYAHFAIVLRKLSLHFPTSILDKTTSVFGSLIPTFHKTYYYDHVFIKRSLLIEEAF